MNSGVLLVMVVATALVFDFTNGFHDTANSMATAIATGALPPRVAVGLSALLNVAGAFLSIAVATTIAKGIVDSTVITLPVVFSALVGAILWNVFTWYLGIPSSSSHALIGGILGATLVIQGRDAVHWSGIVQRVAVPGLLSPLIAGGIALVCTLGIFTALQRVRSESGERGYRIGQIGSASLLSLAHGTNDAQKTMGVITLALVAHGNLDPQSFSVPTWVIGSAALAMGCGTYAGGWRVIRTVGRRLTPVVPPQGFASEVSAATVILTAAAHGYPLSTTHVVSGSVVGSGVGRRLAAVRWGLAGQMAIAWTLTVPSSAAVAAVVAGVVNSVGGTASALICAGGAASGVVLMWLLARRAPVTAENVNAEGTALAPAEPSPTRVAPVAVTGR